MHYWRVVSQFLWKCQLHGVGSRKNLLFDCLLEVLLADKLKDVCIFHRQEKVKDKSLCDKNKYGDVIGFLQNSIIKWLESHYL